MHVAIHKCLCAIKNILASILTLLINGIEIITEQTYQKCNGDLIVYKSVNGEVKIIATIPLAILDPSAEEDCQCNCDDETTEPLTCDYTVTFKSDGLDTLNTDAGEIPLNGGNGYSSFISDPTQIAAALAEINAWLANNGGGTATIEYLEDSIMTLAITGTPVTFSTANDNSNPGPHEFTQSNCTS